MKVVLGTSESGQQECWTSSWSHVCAHICVQKCLCDVLMKCFHISPVSWGLSKLLESHPIQIQVHRQYITMYWSHCRSKQIQIPELEEKNEVVVTKFLSCQNLNRSLKKEGSLMNKSRSSMPTAISISWHCNFQGMCFLLFLFAIQNGWDNIPPGSVKRNYPFLSAFPWTLLLPDLRARINNPPHSLISALSSHRARKSEDLVQYRINEVCIMFITSQRHGQYNNQQILDPFPPSFTRRQGCWYNTIAIERNVGILLRAGLRNGFWTSSSSCFFHSSQEYRPSAPLEMQFLTPHFRWKFVFNEMHQPAGMGGCSWDQQWSFLVQRTHPVYDLRFLGNSIDTAEMHLPKAMYTAC